MSVIQLTKRNGGASLRAMIGIVTALTSFALLGEDAKAAFYTVAERNGRWSVFDPDGKEHPVLGMGHVPYSDRNADCLRRWGFNDLGGGGAPEFCGKGFSHTVFLGFDGACYSAEPELYIRKASGGPMTALPNMFSPGFAAFCDKLASERCAPLRNDRDLLGYFLDNELCWWAGGTPDEGLFDAVRALPADHSARKELERFVAGREVTHAVKLAFLEHAADRYFTVTSAAVRRHDPNHLVLGCRFAGMDGAHDVVWQAAGRHCDVISFNIYPHADLEENRVSCERGGLSMTEVFARYFRLAKKPILVSEWSFPALDTGRSCRFGAGQRVPTQVERAKAVELFVRTVLASPYVVGYEMYKWCDDPVDGRPGVSPENCNYGIVTEDGRPYEQVVKAFSDLNARALELRAARAPGAQVRFERVGADWSLGNDAGVRLSGRVGGAMVSCIELKGRPYGSYGSLIEVRSRHDWLNAIRTTKVAFARKGPAGVLTITAETHVSDGRFCEVVHRLTLGASDRTVTCEVVSVRNLSAGRICLASAYIFPRPLENQGVVAETDPIRVGHVPRSTFWRYPDGRRYGIRSDDPALRDLGFSTDENGLVHADASFVPYERLVWMEKGESYAPPSPWRAELLLE